MESDEDDDEEDSDEDEDEYVWRFSDCYLVVSLPLSPYVYHCYFIVVMMRTMMTVMKKR
jgi:hypothetical protein